MKKGNKKQTAREVKQYEQSLKKAHAAFDKFSALGRLPVVKEHLSAQKAAEQPDEKTQERATILSEAHERLYHAISKLKFIEVAITSGEVREWTGDDEGMGLHLLMTEIAEQLQKVDDKILKVRAA